jgi:hypothetical protein
MGTVHIVIVVLQLNFVIFAIIIFVIHVMSVNTSRPVRPIHTTTFNGNFNRHLVHPHHIARVQEKVVRGMKSCSSLVFNVERKLINSVSSVTIIIVRECGWATLDAS